MRSPHEAAPALLAERNDLTVEHRGAPAARPSKDKERLDVALGAHDGLVVHAAVPQHS
ncbi:hypothetical protein [Streptomyces anulatus]|uniref:hypothetical protein n=1 Tax=Streptomyces anulatus TaxID=1892 RepID=UPI0034433A71